MYFFPSVTGFMLINSLLSGQSGAFRSALSHLILPTIVLGTIPLAVIARQTRSAMLEVLERGLRAHGARQGPRRRDASSACTRSATRLIPVVTTIGLQVGVLMAGAILTESIFSWPGIGKWMIDSVSKRDYPVIQGGLLIIAAIIMLVNLSRRPALRPHQSAHPAPLRATGRDRLSRPAPHRRRPSAKRAASHDRGVLALFLGEPRGGRRARRLRAARRRRGLRAACRALRAE